jgi:hypothetical protein
MHPLFHSKCTSGRGDVAGKNVGWWIWCKKCVHMYVNVKMMLVETIPGIWDGYKGDHGAGEFKCDILYTL